jgi:UDP-N-acetylmuramate dehydrogenase
VNGDVEATPPTPGPGPLPPLATPTLFHADRQRIARDIQRRVGVRARYEEPLAPLTTMRVGGPADLYAEARTSFELRGLVRFARSRGLPFHVMGRGSNLIVSDAGMRGLVVRVRAEGVRVEGCRVTVEAGLLMARLSTVARSAGLGGAEFALAIPGTIGGAVWANAGAHGADVRSILVAANVLPGDGGEEAALDGNALGLAYRDSRLKHAPGPYPDIVVSAVFELESADPADIERRLAEIRLWRREHQPVSVPSAGSVFRNPPGGEPAGALVDRAGLKGARVGGAVVSERHANFIVNDGAATAADVRRLAETMRRTVAERFGVALEYEVLFAGDWSAWTEEGTR